MNALLLLAALLLPVAAEEPAPTCHGLPATIVGTAGDDRLSGTPGDDVIVAKDGADEVYAGRGDDVVCGGPGADILFGDRGDDQLWSHGGGPEEVWGGQGDDVLHLLLPTAPVFMVDGASGHDTVIVRSPGLSGRATWSASTGEATRRQVLWGRIGTVDEVAFSGGIDWTCRRTGPVEVTGC
jgi:Ca2+-binding RTX toxin-like protein